MHIKPTGVNRQQMRGNSVLGKTVILGWEFETIETALIGHLGGDLDPWEVPFCYDSDFSRALDSWLSEVAEDVEEIWTAWGDPEVTVMEEARVVGLMFGPELASYPPKDGNWLPNIDQIESLFHLLSEDYEIPPASFFVSEGGASGACVLF